jgi:uncharacterized protein (TIGR00369 family)
LNDRPLNREQLQDRLLRSPFNAFLNLEIQNVNQEQQEIAVNFKLRPEFERLAGLGQWHGGPIAAAIDIVGDYALAMLIGDPLPTIGFSVDYLKPATGDLALVARVRRRGRTVAVVDVEVLTQANVLVALGRATYSTVAP